MKKALVFFYACAFIVGLVQPVIAARQPAAAAQTEDADWEDLVVYGAKSFGKWVWEQIKNKVGPEAALYVAASLAPYVARPTVRAAVSGWRKSRRGWLHAEDYIGDLGEYSIQAVQGTCYAGLASWLYLRGKQDLTKMVKHAGLAGALQKMGLAWTAWQLYKGPLTFSKHFVWDHYRPGLWRDHAGHVMHARALPHALTSLCQRLRNRDGDNEFADCRGSALLKGTAADNDKRALVHAMAHEIGTDLVYFVSFDDIRRDMESKSAGEVIADLFEWVTARSVSYDQPMAVLAITGFDRWLASNNPQEQSALYLLYRKLDDQRRNFSGAVRMNANGSPLEQSMGAARGHMAVQAGADGARIGFQAAAYGLGAALAGEEYQFVDMELRRRVLVIGVGGADANNDVYTNRLERENYFKQFVITMNGLDNIALPNLPGLFNAAGGAQGDAGAGIVNLLAVPDLRLDALAGGHPHELDMLLHKCQHPEAYVRRQGEPTVTPSLLLYGPPGTGKTTLIRAFAGSLGEQLVEVKVSRLLSAKDPARYIDMAFARARSIAARNASRRAVVFIDEVGAIARPRSQYASPADATALEALVTEMDGIAGANERIIVLATSNTPPDQLEPAFVRPGRFSETVEVTAQTFDTGELLRYFVRVCGSDQAQQMPADQAAAINWGWAANDTRVQQPANGQLALEELINAAHGFTAAEIKTAVTRARDVAIFENREASLHDIVREIEAIRGHRRRREAAEQPHAWGEEADHA